MSARAVPPPLEALTWTRKREWAPLDELCQGIFDCPHSTPELTENGPLVVRSQDIRSGIFRWHEAARVSEATYRERIARAEPRFGDILYSREGTYFAIAAEMPREHRVCLGQRMVLIRPDPSRMATRFLRFWLNSPTLSRHIHGFRDGTVAERLNMPTIRGLPVPLFELTEQEAIADVLCALDDKIELNRRMNETLEAMAQAIFRDWFVDFGPTRRKQALLGANAASRKRAGLTDPVAIMGGLTSDPTRAAELAALFPPALGDNGLPEGWSKGTLADLCELKREYDLPTKDRVSGPVPIISSSGASGWHNTAMAKGPGIVTGRYGTIGEVHRSTHDFWPLNTTLYVRDYKGHPYWFVFHMLVGLDFQKFTDKAAVPGINRNDLHRDPLLLPPIDLMTTFDREASILMSKVDASDSQNDTLAAMRDLLLPKLMSGEIRLRAAEAIAEAAQ